MKTTPHSPPSPPHTPIAGPDLRGSVCQQGWPRRKSRGWTDSLGEGGGEICRRRRGEPPRGGRRGGWRHMRAACRRAAAAAVLSFPGTGNPRDPTATASSSSALLPASLPHPPAVLPASFGGALRGIGPRCRLPLPGKSCDPLRRSGGAGLGGREKMATLGSEPQPFVSALSVATLHPHHHPHHHHHPYQHHGGAGANSGAGGGGSGSGGGFNLPLNRGLERALEEAANSGGLNLSARKLKEFPRTATPGHDLSDTVQAGERGGRECEWLAVVPPRRGGQYEMWPRWGAHRPMLSRVRDRVGAGEAVPADGTVTPASPGDRWCSLGRAGVRAAAVPASVRLPGSPRRGGSAGAPAAVPGLAGAPRARGGSGMCAAAAPASWAPRMAGSPGAASAPRTQAGRLCVGASPILVGKPRQRWRALGRPEGIGAEPRTPSAASPSDPATWCRLRGGAKASSFCACARKEPLRLQ